MSICYHGQGCLILNDKIKTQEFIDEFKTLVNITKGRFMYNKEKHLIQFKNYARYVFMEQLMGLFQNNIEVLNEGQIWFSCYDEDIPMDEKGFPFKRFIEIADGKLTDQFLYKRLPPEWNMYNEDYEWFEKNSD